MKNIVNIWAQPFYAQANLDNRRSYFWGAALLMLVGQLLAMALFIWSPKKHEPVIFLFAIAFSVAALLVITMFSWYVLLVQNIGLQYSPMNARLVPGIRRYLVAAIVIPILVCALIATLVWRVALHEYSVWPAFVSVLVMVFFTVIVRTQWAVVPMILCFQVPAMMERAGLERLDKILERQLGMPSSFFLLVAIPLIIYLGVGWLFATRDDALFVMHQRSRALRAGLTGMQMNENPLSIGLSSVFMWWMRYCVTQRTKHAAALAEWKNIYGFIFGPRVHWTTISSQVLMMLVTGVLAVFLLDTFALRKENDFLAGFAFGFGGILLIAQPIFFSLMLFYTLYRTRHEQALLRMSPTTLSNQELDRLLLRYVILQFFILYALSLLISLPICIFVLHGGAKAASLILFLSCLLPLASTIVMNYAKMKTMSDHHLLKAILLSLLVFAMGIVLGFSISFALLWWYAALVALLSLLSLRQTLSRHAQVLIFPVGRSV